MVYKFRRYKVNQTAKIFYVPITKRPCTYSTMLFIYLLICCTFYLCTIKKNYSFMQDSMSYLKNCKYTHFYIRCLKN